MRTFKSDYIVGRANEITYLPYIQRELKDPTLKHTSKKDIFDFIGENKLVELKSRNFDCYKYPDTMIGLNKIEFAKANPDKEYYFCFLFTDGLYYWKYNEDDKLNYRSGGRFDRGYNEIKQYAYIPISLLKNISIDTIDEPEKILL
jgi:hypothetical protein